ncbi:MlaD family protein [Paraconexibacter algicola]|uniref:Mce/MlaD domain-containing protein n=1 Tax=Paraconexibacter algicola TaxID=2133960 RepID=A0A2T4UG11_9ACTN|nr:MlaD family protein [Paraconexibacter algicola]PTL58170.1 hypothetical protein C7Y72_00140 [Paraconexibacter algicola]
MRPVVAPLLALLAVCAIVVVLVGRDAETGARFSVVVGEATNVVEGQAIRQRGSEVGHVVSIEPANGGRDARLELEIDDEAWPLPKGSKMALRWGGTANFGNRYIALTPGRQSGTAVEEGGTFPARDFTVPVEFDELLARFPDAARQDLRRFLREGGPALKTSRVGLRRTLQVAPPALVQARHVVQDIASDQRAVRTLVRSADRVLGAVDAAQPDVRRLLEGAGGTFDAIADESQNVQAALSAAPGSLRRARTTLALADETLVRARALTRDLAPGVTAVRRTVQPLDGLLQTVRDIGPDATKTLVAARQATPSLNPLVERLTGRSPQLESIGKQAVENLECIRPYTPEANAFFSNWGDFFSGTDGKDKLIRAQVQNFAPAFSNVSGYNSAQAKRLFSGLEYGLPRPPGTVAGQPWFLPECGAGSDAIDPNKDPEIRDSAKVFELPKLMPIVPLPKADGR